MGGDLSELKLENNKGLGSDGLHIRNRVTLNDKQLMFLRIHIWIKYLWCSLTQIYISYLEHIRVSRRKKKNKNTDADNVCGNTLLPVTQKACLPH